MVIANTSDGRTLTFDLVDASRLQALQALLASDRITALALHSNGVQTVLPIPKRFARRSIRFGAEQLINGDSKPIGERIYAQAGSVRVSLTLTYGSKLVRCDLERMGRMLYNPSTS